MKNEKKSFRVRLSTISKPLLRKPVLRQFAVWSSIGYKCTGKWASASLTKNNLGKSGLIMEPI